MFNFASETILAVERTAEIRGDGVDDDEGGACTLYVPGRHDTVYSQEHATWKTVRRCKTCDCVEDDHEEPADSERATIVPEPMLAVEEQVAMEPAGARTDADHARDVAHALMGGPPETWFPRLLEQVAAHLGRAPNQWERAALRHYVCGVAIDLLAASVAPAPARSL